MENKEWTFERPKNLAPGPWTGEPDKMQWMDEKSGYPCLIVRNHKGGGHLCGYVGVPTSHPLHGKDYETPDVSVHGGLTFADKCQGKTDGICHEVAEGEPDNVWWFGFDCAHSGDLSPYYDSKYQLCRAVESYKDIGYVRAETLRLAAQLKALETNQPR